MRTGVSWTHGGKPRIVVMVLVFLVIHSSSLVSSPLGCFRLGFLIICSLFSDLFFFSLVVLLAIFFISSNQLISSICAHYTYWIGSLWFGCNNNWLTRYMITVGWSTMGLSVSIWTVDQLPITISYNHKCLIQRDWRSKIWRREQSCDIHSNDSTHSTHSFPVLTWILLNLF